MESFKLKNGMRNFRACSEEISEGNLGACIVCGAEAEGVEPDARAYKCEECGALAVYGLEELLVMGRVSIAEGE